MKEIKNKKRRIGSLIVSIWTPMICPHVRVGAVAEAAVAVAGTETVQMVGV